MIQIFLLGSSNVYGVGAENSGWGDLLKQALHKKMYSSGGVGEKYEVYNFSKSGANIGFVLKTFPEQLKEYGRNHKVITVVSVGGNNAKAENKPDNFVSTIEEYSKDMSQLLDMLKKSSNHVIAVSAGYYDESKTNPKHNPLTGGKSYFTNARSKMFSNRFKELCEKRQITLITDGMSEEEWKEKYLFTDGLHPNQAGHQLISQKVLEQLDKIL